MARISIAIKKMRRPFPYGTLVLRFMAREARGAIPLCDNDYAVQGFTKKKKKPGVVRARRSCKSVRCFSSSHSTAGQGASCDQATSIAFSTTASGMIHFTGKDGTRPSGGKSRRTETCRRLRALRITSYTTLRHFKPPHRATCALEFEPLNRKKE